MGIGDLANISENCIYGIRSKVNGKFVCAVDNGNGWLVASKELIGSCEKFSFKKNFDGTYSLIAKCNARFVCANNGNNKNLLANRSIRHTWQKFYIIENSDDTISFKSMANEKYVGTNEFSILCANKDIIDLNTKFKIEKYGIKDLVLAKLSNIK